ncbi:MAG: spore maturation protein [Magnetococcus sp. DMHC-6]
MNGIFFALVLISFLVTAEHQIFWQPSAAGEISPMEVLTNGMVEGANGSVTLALGLVGMMTLFLGLMKVAEAGGLLTILARLIRPLMIRLFPDVPADHPAMGAMIMNMAANAMGLGNAATPFGIRAMQELDRLNPVKGTATNAMALFLAINTSSVTLLPTGVIALRAAAGSTNPAAILPTTLFATFCSTMTAILAVKLYQRFFSTPVPDLEETPHLSPIAQEGAGQLQMEIPDPQEAYPLWISIFSLTVVVSFIPITILYGRHISPWVIPGLMMALLGFGALRRVRVYEVFVSGAQEGFQVAIRIIPYLVAILVAVGMFRASGAMDFMVALLGPFTSAIGLPAEALPMALLRPLSGSGAYGILASLINDPAIGPDSYTGLLVSTLQGSTETTFYVLAVYFGAIQVRRMRHTLAAALTADLAGILGSILICTLLY